MRIPFLIAFMLFSGLGIASDLELSSDKTCAIKAEDADYEISLSKLALQGEDWKLLNLELMLSDSSIPKQLSQDDRLEMSCGPISMAMSLMLMEGSLFPNEISIASRYQKYIDWVLGFEYFEQGVLPHNLVGRSAMSLRKHKPKFSMLNKFEDVLMLVRAEIDARRPVVTLLVLGAMRQHYVLWAGYNDKLRSALLVDTDGRLLSMPYDVLECIMYAGERDDENDVYNTYVRQTLEYFRTLTDFDFYNLIAFEPLFP